MSGPWIGAFAALWVVVLTSVVVELGFLRRATLVLERVEARLASRPTHLGAAPGDKVGNFVARRRDGTPVSSTDLLRSPAMYLFMEPGCEPCANLAAELEREGASTDGLPLYIVMEDSPIGRAINLPSTIEVLYQAEGAVSAAFTNLATPQAYVVGVGGVVQDSVVPGSVESIQNLAKR